MVGDTNRAKKQVARNSTLMELMLVFYNQKQPKKDLIKPMSFTTAKLFINSLISYKKSKKPNSTSFFD